MYDYIDEERRPQQKANIADVEQEHVLFYADSRSTTHITNTSCILNSSTPYNGNDMVYMGNGNALKITHIRHGDLYKLNAEPIKAFTAPT